MQVQIMTPSKIHEAGPNTSYLCGLVLTTTNMNGANEDLKGHFEMVWWFGAPLQGMDVIFRNAPIAPLAPSEHVKYAL